jgi:hypothetical protein
MAFADVPPFRCSVLPISPHCSWARTCWRPFRRVSLDFRGRKVRFQLRRCKSQAVAISTSMIASTSRLSSTGSPESAAIAGPVDLSLPSVLAAFPKAWADPRRPGSTNRPLALEILAHPGFPHLGTARAERRGGTLKERRNADQSLHPPGHFFGVCEGLGEDLRIHPNLLRVALAGACCSGTRRRRLRSI